MNQPEFVKDSLPKDIFTGHKPENHPLRDSLISKLDIITWGTIIIPGYIGTGILGLGGGLDENIRNLSFGMIGWTILGTGLVYFAPILAKKTYSISLGILEDIVKLGHHGSDHV